MTDGQRVWLIFDARAWSGDTSEAYVLDTAQSRREAMRERRHYPGCAVYSYEDRDGELVDERGPYR